MAIMRFAARDLGPFRDINIDFSDGNGKPHLGPHIFAGVNGSGKSTILKGLAMKSTLNSSSFNVDSILPLCRSRATILGLQRHMKPYGQIAFISSLTERLSEIEKWGRQIWTGEFDFSMTASDIRSEKYSPFHSGILMLGGTATMGLADMVAAYAPGIRISHAARDSFADRQRDASGSLSFETTVDNVATQQWIVDLFSRKAIAQESHKGSVWFEKILDGMNQALTQIYGSSAQLTIDVDTLEPRVKLFGRTLNFSQLPQGVASTLGWLVDFNRRRVVYSDNNFSQRGGVLIIDEVEAYLHPRWQRRVLPALRSGLPDVQLIVASHSPFVIASSPNARIHMLSLDESTGEATYNGATDAPIGKSVNAILRDIFGVESRFDVKTEDQLNELNDLRQLAQSGKLKSQQAARMAELSKELSARSEELKFLVGPSLAQSDQSSIESRFLPPTAKPRKTKPAARK